MSKYPFSMKGTQSKPANEATKNRDSTSSRPAFDIGRSQSIKETRSADFQSVSLNTVKTRSNSNPSRVA